MHIGHLATFTVAPVRALPDYGGPTTRARALARAFENLETSRARILVQAHHASETTGSYLLCRGPRHSQLLRLDL